MYGLRIPSLPHPHPNSPSFFLPFPLSILHSSCSGRCSPRRAGVGGRAGGRATSRPRPQRKLTSPSLKQVIYYQMKNWHDGGTGGRGRGEREWLMASRGRGRLFQDGKKSKEDDGRRGERDTQRGISPVQSQMLSLSLSPLLSSLSFSIGK